MEIKTINEYVKDLKDNSWKKDIHTNNTKKYKYEIILDNNDIITIYSGNNSLVKDNVVYIIKYVDNNKNGFIVEYTYNKLTKGILVKNPTIIGNNTDIKVTSDNIAKNIIIYNEYIDIMVNLYDKIGFYILFKKKVLK